MTHFYAHNKCGRSESQTELLDGTSPGPSVRRKINIFTSSRLQDEMEELRSEMLEMRDMYMEDDVYQLQELRQQLEQVGARGRVGALAPKCTFSVSPTQEKGFATKH